MISGQHGHAVLNLPSRMVELAEGICRVDGFFPPGVVAIQTDRRGGASQGPFGTFNLATHVGDDPLAVGANRRRLSQHVPARILWLEQVHGTTVVSHDDPAPMAPPRADACIAADRGLACAVMSADCLPLLIARPCTRQVAAVHAGWRGLHAGVIEAALEALLSAGRHGQDLDEWYVWMGPAISARSFEVGPDVRDAFLHSDPETDAFFQPVSGTREKWLADLQGLALHRVLAWQTRCASTGYLPMLRVSRDDGCTVSEADRYYSYRRDRLTGRMVTLIARC